MTVGHIIFARNSSSRLPGKALLPLAGRALLGRVLDRVRRVPGDNTIIIATSRDATDDQIAAYADAEGVAVFRGDLNDVAGRALACAEHYGLRYFSRVCGDRPFLCPRLIFDLMNRAVEEDLDLATNTLKKTYPAGLATEIISTQSLARVVESTQDQADREHVTPYYYRHPDAFRILNQESETPESAALSLALDTQTDFDRTEWILRQLGTIPETATQAQVCALATSWNQKHA